jgi:DNA-binding NarL/FixJ family response regulator
MQNYDNEDISGRMAREVLNILATGKSTKEIARQLYLSEPTIKTHLASNYRKLEVNNRISAVAVARDNSWLGE